MAHIRPAAVAGLFYPDDEAQLREDISSMLSAANAVVAEAASKKSPKAIIVPHAGYVYSGPVAASAYALLFAARDTITRVILLGPSHRVPLTGMATSTADCFETPLGTVTLDHSAIDNILALPQVKPYDLGHAQEHSLEVHLPFLQFILPSFKLVPVVVGDTSAEEVQQVLELLWGGKETLIVISSDLSHYHSYKISQQMDLTTCRAIESLDDTHIDYERACGRIPVSGMLRAARHHNMKVKTLDLRNSGDTAGTKDSVVGYGAWAFEEHHAE